MDLRKYQVDLPSVSFMILVFSILTLLLVAIEYRDTLLAIAIRHPEITNTFDWLKLSEAQANDSIASAESISYGDTRLFGNVVTFLLWGVGGFLLYYLSHIFHMVFIHPISDDISSSHFVNANKHSYRSFRRIMWYLAIVATALIVGGSIQIFNTVTRPLYILSIYEPGVENILILIGSLFLLTMMSAGVRIGTRVVIRAY